jgi:hypothetical protein
VSARRASWPSTAALECVVVVDADAALLDVAGRQVAVFDALGQRVFVDRLAKVTQVVGGDLGIRRVTVNSRGVAVRPT